MTRRRTGKPRLTPTICWTAWPRLRPRTPHPQKATSLGRQFPRASATEVTPFPAVITKVDRMKTRQGESLFLKVDVGGETVRVFGRPEELAERLEAGGYDIPASEVEAG